MFRNLYIYLVMGTLAMLLSIVLFSKKQTKKIPTFKERSGAIALSGEWLNTKKAIEGLLLQIEQRPDDDKAKLELSQAYIQEGRVTGDHAYYDQAALELLDNILTNTPDNFDALCCKATVLLSQHHFTEGLAIANKALPLNPHSAFIYGILCDANLELGKYNEAVKMADKMMSIRPDIRSYSRVSYLREIYGDLPGAIAAIKMAVSAGYPGLEQTEWSRCVLGHLYEMTGHPESAENEYNTVLQERPDYAYAIAGLGRVSKVRGNYKEAINYFKKAQGMIVEYSFTDELTDLYRMVNEKEKAEKNALEVIDMLGPQSDNEGTTGHGHYADKELAYAYLKVDDLTNALKHALIEFDRRPDNIEICETLAWVRYKRGEIIEADKVMFQALKTGSTNPELLCKAGLIKMKTGDLVNGKKLINKAFSINPYLDMDLKDQAMPFLALK